MTDNYLTELDVSENTNLVNMDSWNNDIGCIEVWDVAFASVGYYFATASL